MERYKSFPGIADAAVDIESDGPLSQLPFLAEAEDVGDVNLVVSGVDITIPPFSSIVQSLAERLVKRTQGLMPAFSLSDIVIGSSEVSYQVVKWEVNRMVTVEELHTIGRLVGKAFNTTLKLYKQIKGKLACTHLVEPLDYSGNKIGSGRMGVYLGPASRYSQDARGITVHRKFRSSQQAKLFRSDHPIELLSMTHGQKKISTAVELRDDGHLSQDAFLILVGQVSYLLSEGKVLDSRSLATEVFRELSRVGTRVVNKEDIFGMEESLDVVSRALLLPLQNPEAAQMLGVSPESTLLVGVPGVGKTFLENYLMTQDYNAVFVVVDSDKLQSDLENLGAGKSSEVLSRCDRIIQLTGLPVILILDDVDVVLENKEEGGSRGVVTRFLNLMQGIRQRGIHLLASTNYPEKIDRRLFEPGRLSKVVHIKMPNEEERAGVLGVYLNKLPFGSPELCAATIQWCAQNTEGWTQRFLWELVTEACRTCIARSESSDLTVELDDFKDGLKRVLQGRNLEELREWNDTIARFVSSHTRRIGFDTSNDDA